MPAPPHLPVLPSEREAGGPASEGETAAREPSRKGGAPRNVPALQSLLPEELVELAPEIEIGEARKLVSLAHRHGALPARSPAGVRRRAFDAARAATHVPALELVARVPSQ